MSKYIIDTGDYLFTTDGVLVVGFDCDNKPATFYNSLDNLEELNSDYINENFGELQDEAYQRGHDDGYEAGCATAFKPVSDAEYQRGLEDAWEVAQKVVCETTAGGMSLDTLKEIFGVQSPVEIIQSNTAQQAIDKIKAYEHKDSDCIEVGDEVNWDGDKYVVTYLNYNFETSEIADYDLLAYDGSVIDHVKKCAFTKTGKHYDIQSILEAMRT